MQYSNPQVDALLDAARATSDQGQRATDYQQAQKLILQDASYVFINHGLNIQATTNNIKGFTLLPTGMRYLGGLAGQRTEPADDGHSGLCAGTGAALPFAVTVRAFPPGGYVFLCRRPGRQYPRPDSADGDAGNRGYRRQSAPDSGQHD